MIKIYDIKSKIEDLNITIQVFNSLNSFFVQFLNILSHEIREKKKLSMLKSFAKLLENKELQIKNQDKAMASYDKKFI